MGGPRNGSSSSPFSSSSNPPSRAFIRASSSSSSSAPTAVCDGALLVELRPLSPADYGDDDGDDDDDDGDGCGGGGLPPRNAILGAMRAPWGRGRYGV